MGGGCARETPISPRVLPPVACVRLGRASLEMSGPERDQTTEGLGPIECKPIEGGVSGPVAGAATGALESQPGWEQAADEQRRSAHGRRTAYSSTHLVLAHRQRLSHHSSCRSSVPSLAPSASVFAVSTPVSIDFSPPKAHWSREQAAATLPSRCLSLARLSTRLHSRARLYRIHRDRAGMQRKCMTQAPSASAPMHADPPAFAIVEQVLTDSPRLRRPGLQGRSPWCHFPRGDWWFQVHPRQR